VLSVRLQVRQGIVSGSLGKSGTPLGTPKAFGKSPLESPLVGDAVKLQALNLEPGVSKVRTNMIAHCWLRCCRASNPPRHGFLPIPQLHTLVPCKQQQPSRLFATPLTQCMRIHPCYGTKVCDDDWTMFGAPSRTGEYQQLSVNSPNITLGDACLHPPVTCRLTRRCMRTLSSSRRS
jgi:hypothetical protein